MRILPPHRASIEILKESAMDERIIPITNKKVKDRTGQRYGKILVIGYVGSITNKHNTSAAFLCICDCGNEKIVVGNHLASGIVKSCGCGKSNNGEKTRIKPKHGLRKHPLYGRWNLMHHRCENPKNQDYHAYGARGISVCKRWSGLPDGLLNFIEDMGIPEKGMTIDRIDVNGNYEPENCRWLNQVGQQNNRRSNRHIFLNGEKMTMAQAIKITGIKQSVLWRAMKRKDFVFGDFIFENELT